MAILNRKVIDPAVSFSPPLETPIHSRAIVKKLQQPLFLLFSIGLFLISIVVTGCGKGEYDSRLNSSVQRLKSAPPVEDSDEELDEEFDGQEARDEDSSESSDEDDEDFDEEDDLDDEEFEEDDIDEADENPFDNVDE